MATAITITCDLNAKPPKVTLDPNEQKIRGAVAISWITPEACETSIEFTSGCPFPPAAGDASGHYSSSGGDITTTPADTPADGEKRPWPYTVTVISTDKKVPSAPADGVIVTQNP